MDTQKRLIGCTREISCAKCNLEKLCVKRTDKLGYAQYHSLNPYEVEKLNAIYDTPIRTTKTEIYPNMTSLRTEQTLSGVTRYDRKHHRTFPRVRRTYNMTKPNGWKSVWGIYRNRRTIGGHSWFDSNSNRDE